MRFGLRLQLVLALSVAFVMAFALLGVAAIQLNRRSREEDRARDAQATARAVAAALEERPTHSRFVRIADATIGIAGVRGMEFEQDTLAPWVRGLTGLGRMVEEPVGDRAMIRIYVQAPAQAPLSNLFLMYVAVTGGVILLMTNFALTYLIVRPIDAVRRASERLARGGEVEVPVRGAAEVARLATTFNDMARQLRADRSALEQRLIELEQTTRELEAAQDQVLRSARLASVGRLAAGVAHEIGNPLAAILGLIELSRDEDDDAARDEFLARIQKETERINGIIRDLLDFARQGDDEEVKGSASLQRVIEDSVQLVAPQKDLRKLSIEQRVEEDVPAVRGSADRLSQVVLNLLLNAADAMNGEGEITVELSADADDVVLVVSDSGPGIPEDVLPTIFEPFVTTKPVGQGTGLGLAVCHTIIERLGGTIEASNADGARFEIRLPAATT